MKYKSFKISSLSALLALFFCSSSQAVSLGNIAQNLTVASKSIAELIHTLCWITGIALIAGALLKYKRHRENPVEAPLSMVFVMLLAGIALITLTFIPMEF